MDFIVGCAAGVPVGLLVYIAVWIIARTTVTLRPR